MTLWILLRRVDQWGRATTGIWWLSIVGLAEHQAVGSATWLLVRGLCAWPLRAPMVHPLVMTAALLVVGAVHELTQAQMGGSDFEKANGGPANGLCDVLAFVPWWAWL